MEELKQHLLDWGWLYVFVIAMVLILLFGDKNVGCTVDINSRPS